MLFRSEPTTALDVIVQKNILELLDRLRREEGMGLLLVSHDLGVVGSVCSRIAVMYAGQIVEEGPAEHVLGQPRMPYTAGLLASTRRDKAQKRLVSIPGVPPPLGDRAVSCRFAPRCPLAKARCHAEEPNLVTVAEAHSSACWYSDDVATLAGALT